MLERFVGQRIRQRKSHVLLLGPRQVGKSTLCSRLNPDLTINLAREREFLRFAKDPGLLTRECSVLPGASLVCVDEIQRVPALLNELQSLMDHPDQHRRFILTGSSARKLRRGQANLLPGRITLEYLDPLSVFELNGNDFSLERALQVGMLPGIYLGDEVEAVDILGTYAEVYLREEIQAEAAARNVGAYARFLDVVALESGNWINYSKLGSDTEIPKETIRRYMGVLEDTLMALRLPPFQLRANRNRRAIQRERFLLFDIGVRNALVGAHRHPLSQEQVGRAFEQWLILQVAYLNRCLRKDWVLSAYRTEGGAEVDLVIERHNDVVGLEVKYAKTLRANANRGLQSLSEVVGKKKPYRPIIAFRGERAQKLADGTLAMPFMEGLQWLRDGE